MRNFLTKSIKKFSVNELKFANNLPENLKQLKFSRTQMEIIDSINNDTNRAIIILADNYTSKRFAYLLGITNRLLSQKLNNDNIIDNKIEDSEIFKSYKQVFKTMQKNYAKNKQKMTQKPRGALIVSKRLDSLTESYKILRTMDLQSNQLKITRIGSSLQGVTHSIESDVNSQ